MPDWVYNLPPLQLGLLMVALFELVSLAGLFLVRRFVLPHIRYHDGVNDALSGTVQSIGVFYGVTIGLIAVGVWGSFSATAGLATNEATAIAMLYRDVSSYPEPPRTALQADLRAYIDGVITEDWPAHQLGQVPITGTLRVNDIQARLTSFEPKTKGQEILHAETLHAFNNLVQARRERMDAVGGGLSQVMWAVIWIGAAISIAVGYFFYLEDPKLHAIAIGLMAAFIGIVLFVIVVNDRPFVGSTAVRSDSYQKIVDTLMKVPVDNLIQLRK